MEGYVSIPQRLLISEGKLRVVISQNEWAADLRDTLLVRGA